MPAPVRVRFAPSPTGLLHVGGLRTALYNALLARGSGGTFVLRIEDTDRARFVPEAEADILDALAWAGLVPDEGPEAGGSGADGGPYGPYRQSERAELYRQAADRLLADGAAYVAFDTPEEIQAARDARATPETPTPHYGSMRADMANSLTLAPDEVQRRLDAGAPHTVRLLVPEDEQVTFADAVRGEVSFHTSTVDDQVLVKSDGMPTYHLANVVDDHAMGITHVIRGEEWLSSVPKHVLLYRALGWTPPAMAHLPLILSPTGGKLSKRSAERAGIPVNVAQYREAGYEPEALVNWLALLGWNPGTEQEVMSLGEMAEAFSLDRIGASGVQVDLAKLEWFNAQHLRALPTAEIARRAAPAVRDRWGDVPDARIEEAAELLRERLTFAHDLADAGYLFDDVTAYDEKGVNKRWKDDSAALVRGYADRLDALDAFTLETTEAAMRAQAEDAGVGFGRIIHPVRLAVTGTTAGAGMFDTLLAIGQAESAARLRRAADTLR